MKTVEEDTVHSTATRLQEELKQKKPFRSTEQQAFLGLLRTGDACKSRFTELFVPEDITFQQYNVLRILRGAGPEGLPTLEIGERMIERTPGVTRIVDRLERKGWVIRVRCDKDRRRVWCRITPSGLDLLARLDEPVGEVDKVVFAGLDHEELNQLIRLLDTVRQRLSETT